MNIYYSTEDYAQAIDDYKKTRKYFKGNNVKLLVHFDRIDLKECSVSDIYNKIENYTKQKFNPANLAIGFDNYFKKKTFDKEELKNLVKFTEIFKEIGVTVGVFDYESFFDYHEVYNADKKIKEISNDIRKNNYSPLEKLMHAYFITQDRLYKNEKKYVDRPGQSRSVYGVLNGDKVVCAGYSELLKSIVQEVDDENVKVFPNLVGYARPKKKGEKQEYDFHQNNIVYIKDDKYKIDGYYYLDPTWDTRIEQDYESIDKNNENDQESSNYVEFLTYRLLHFLIQISDIKNVRRKNTIRDYSKTLNAIRRNRKSKDENSQKENDLIIKKIRKSNNMANVEYVKYASISNEEAKFNEEIDIIEPYNYRAKRYKEDELLNKFLIERQDYQEFIALKEAEKYAKPTDDISKLTKENYKISRFNANKMGVTNDGKVIWEYLNEHSPHVSVDALMGATNVVLQKMHPEFDKNFVSHATDVMMKWNIEESKYCFARKSDTPLTEISMFKK